MSEKEKSGREVWGRRAVYGGIVAGIIGVIAAPELAVLGVGLAAGGVIFENSGENKKQQQAT